MKNKIKWHRYQSNNLVEYEAFTGKFSFHVFKSTENPLKWKYIVALGPINYIIQNETRYDTPKEAKQAAIEALKNFLQETLNKIN
jgi:hypothetical protein